MMISFRKWMFRIWYWYVNRADKNAEVLFMNYGYKYAGDQIELEPADEPNRYSVQLYHLLGSSAAIAGKNIAEIGCGRGGGLSYIVRTFAPASARGIDISTSAINFCRKNYNLEGLTFVIGDAQDLSFIPDNSLDIIINCESSHRYPRMDLFFKEVHRILRPGASLLYTDFGFDHEMAGIKKLLDESGLIFTREMEITDNVVKALEADDSRRRNLVKRLTPAFLHKQAFNFAGNVGGETYNLFASNKYHYFFYVLQKR
jgi:ubiquinone/menaquinone biosynthesis C-methylase UbiE